MIDLYVANKFTGVKRQMLTAISFVKANETGQQIWLFRCDCGGHIRKIKGAFLRSKGNNCGCIHGHSFYDVPTRDKRGKWTLLYRAWVQMRQRCRNKNLPDYKYYGGRGIEVCKKWNFFDQFRHDMEDSLTKHQKENSHSTLDRINVNGDYCKENCRWATRKEQSRNRSDTVFISYNKQTKSVGEWAEELPIKINYKELYKRVFTRKWDLNRAMTQPLRTKKC